MNHSFVAFTVYEFYIIEYSAAGSSICARVGFNTVNAKLPGAIFTETDN